MFGEVLGGDVGVEVGIGIGVDGGNFSSWWWWYIRCSYCHMGLLLVLGILSFAWRYQSLG